MGLLHFNLKYEDLIFKSLDGLRDFTSKNNSSLYQNKYTIDAQKKLFSGVSYYTKNNLIKKKFQKNELYHSFKGIEFSNSRTISHNIKLTSKAKKILFDNISSQFNSNINFSHYSNEKLFNEFICDNPILESIAICLANAIGSVINSISTNLNYFKPIEFSRIVFKIFTRKTALPKVKVLSKLTFIKIKISPKLFYTYSNDEDEIRVAI